MEKSKKRLSLPAWILIGMVAGILVGLLFMAIGQADFTTTWIKPIGDIYINLLKFLIVPIVLVSIMSGVIQLGDIKKVGSVGVRTFIYYMCTTAIAVVIGLVIVNLFKGLFPALDQSNLEGLAYEAKTAPSVMDVIKNIFPDNAVKPLVNADMLPVIVIALFFGAGVLAAGEKGKTVADFIHSLNDVVLKVLMMIIRITPIGVFCLMVNVVAVNGPKIIGSLALILAYTAAASGSCPA